MFVDAFTWPNYTRLSSYHSIPQLHRSYEEMVVIVRKPVKQLEFHSTLMTVLLGDKPHCTSLALIKVLALGSHNHVSKKVSHAADSPKVTDEV